MEEQKKLSALERVRKATENLGEGRKDTLDDGQRVKILSPGMLVFKRFIRNKLAIVGLAILFVMFVFAFFGPFFSPYGETQIFTRPEYVQAKYAGASKNKNLNAFIGEGKNLPPSLKAKFVLAKNKGATTFEMDKQVYGLSSLADGKAYVISKGKVIDSILARGKLRFPSNSTYSDEFKTVMEEAYNNEQDSFEFDGVEYLMNRTRTEVQLSTQEPYALMSVYSYYPATAAEADPVLKELPFRVKVERAIAQGDTEFNYNGQDYTLNLSDPDQILINKNGNPVGMVSDWLLKPLDRRIVLTAPFVQAFLAAQRERATSFTWLPTGVDAPKEETAIEGQDGTAMPRPKGEYKLTRSNAVFYITAEKIMLHHDVYGKPGPKHWCGTDEKGMDMMTRLMYGGRISLLVGFVVVSIQTIIGVLIGGVSGYFGGIVDTLLMRFVDLFNSIPYWPIMIIMGSVMDTLEVNSTLRVYLLMLILGIMGWTGIARIVRGQILMLREQDFMIATEAAGLSVRKRIFRHLVPNVMPLLIVQATMGLGSIIITEATLSFLGLGVKPPLASWGSIINAANNLFVMQNCWWIWLPTGFLIVLTVLGFNFVGDGLRDAYDPRMKR